MFNLSHHPYFEQWTDPVSGIVSHLLTKRVAPLQKSFYFVNSGLTHDGRWLWFEAAHPPGNNKCLAAVCLETTALPCVLPRHHIDPHPRFIDQGRAVCYTSTVRGMPDLAIVQTADILEAM